MYPRGHQRTRSCRLGERERQSHRYALLRLRSRVPANNFSQALPINARPPSHGVARPANPSARPSSGPIPAPRTPLRTTNPSSMRLASKCPRVSGRRAKTVLMPSEICIFYLLHHILFLSSFQYGAPSVNLFFRRQATMDDRQLPRRPQGP
jgi:hypothetical protein